MRLHLPSRRVAALVWAVLIVVLAAPETASAQEPAPAPGGYTPPVFGSISPALLDGGLPSRVPDEGTRACPGCPPRRPFRAMGDVIGINLIYLGVSLAFKPADEKIYYKTYPKIWWNNISYGFEWDDNTFMINQWGHPYQGSTYFSAGRTAPDVCRTKARIGMPCLRPRPPTGRRTAAPSIAAGGSPRSPGSS